MTTDVQAPIEVEEVTIPEVEAPSLEEVETAPTTEAETDTPAEAETPAVRAFADYTEEELAEDERVKAIVYRREQSATDRATARATSEKFAREQQYAASPQFHADLVKLITDAPLDTNGRPQIDPQHIEQATGRVLGRGASAAVEQLANVLSSAAGPNFRLTQAEQTLADAAVLLYQQNPLNSGPLINAWLTAHDRSVLERGESDLRAKIARDDAKQAEASAKVEQAKTAQTARKANPGASPIIGGGVTKTLTLEDIEAIPTNTWLLRPAAERQKLMADATALAAAKR